MWQSKMIKLLLHREWKKSNNCPDFFMVESAKIVHKSFLHKNVGPFKAHIVYR